MADPDLQIRGGGRGGGHPAPEIGGGPGLSKIFLALRASFWPKNKVGEGAGRAPLLDPTLLAEVNK